MGSAALTGKVALVAGATRGAGRGIAIELGAQGAAVYVTGRTRRTGTGLWLHGYRRLPAERLALSHRSAGGRQTGRCQRLSVEAKQVRLIRSRRRRRRPSKQRLQTYGERPGLGWHRIGHVSAVVVTP